MRLPCLLPLLLAPSSPMLAPFSSRLPRLPMTRLLSSLGPCPIPAPHPVPPILSSPLVAPEEMVSCDGFDGVDELPTDPPSSGYLLDPPSPELLSLLPPLPPPSPADPPLPSLSSLVSTLSDTIPPLLSLLSHPLHTLSLHLSSLPSIRASSLSDRAIDRPTDVLSYPFFPYHDPASPLPPYIPGSYTTTPGLLPPPPKHLLRDAESLQSHLHLGDLLLCPDYVRHVLRHDATLPDPGWGERGAAGAVGRSANLARRCQLLLVHGVVHCLGYDHEGGEGGRREMEEVEEWVIGRLEEEGVLVGE